MYNSEEEFGKLILLDVKSVLSIVQIHHFSINRDEISCGILIDILHLLPELMYWPRSGTIFPIFPMFFKIVL